MHSIVCESYLDSFLCYQFEMHLGFFFIFVLNFRICFFQASLILFFEFVKH